MYLNVKSYSVKKWFENRNKKADEDLYIRVLLWAHEKQETGFTWQELNTSFTLNYLQESWVRNIFLTTSDKDRKFFEHFRNDDTVTPNQHYYSLNEKGITAAINYKNLAHAEKSSSLALWFAGFSIFLTATGLLLQYRQNTLTEIQSIPEQISQARARNSAIEFCKSNPDALDSGLYYLDGSGRNAPCSKVLQMK